jgi:hypothetical protein
VLSARSPKRASPLRPCAREGESEHGSIVIITAYSRPSAAWCGSTFLLVARPSCRGLRPGVSGRRPGRDALNTPSHSLIFPLGLFCWSFARYRTGSEVRLRIGADPSSPSSCQTRQRHSLIMFSHHVRYLSLNAEREAEDLFLFFPTVRQKALCSASSRVLAFRGLPPREVRGC